MQGQAVLCWVEVYVRARVYMVFALRGLVRAQFFSRIVPVFGAGATHPLAQPDHGGFTT